MDHSKAYGYFIYQFNKKKTGEINENYDNDLFEKINEFERNELERLVYEGFKNEDRGLIKLVSRLRNYDGIALLKEALEKNSECIPSIYNAMLQVELYINTMDESYYKQAFVNLKTEDPVVRSEVVSVLEGIPASRRLLEDFMDIYIYDEDILIRTKAIYEILYCAGILRDRSRTRHSYAVEQTIKSLSLDGIEERKQAAKGFLEKYGK